MLAWDPSTDPTTVGYCLYYGSASGNYTTRVDLKTNTTVTVTNLTGGQTYYFAATAYNAANVESPPSNEASFVASTNPPPSLNPVNTQYVNALGRLLVTNKATTPNTVGRVYTYTLDPGAPTGMRINPSTGLLSWFAPMSAAGNSYAVTVHVTDNAVPPASTAQTLTVVVNHGLQLSLGPAVVAVGQTGSMTLSLFSSAGVTNVSFKLSAPTNFVSNVTVQSVLPGLAVTQSPVGSVFSTITLRMTNGATLQGLQAVAQINFTAIAGQSSSFRAMNTFSVTAVQADGTLVPTCVGAPGKVVLVGAQSLVEGQTQTNGQRNLMLYGPVGKSYQVQACANPKAGSWTNMFSGSFSNLTQPFPGVASANQVIFFRAITH